MFLVGLTGGIAVGKSTVARRFAEHSAEIIDADQVARDVVAVGTDAWKKIVEHFGEGILTADGSVDRPKLGRIVFADPRRRALLNEITHPPVMAEIADRLELYRAYDGLVVLDVPLLVEAASEERAPTARRAYDAVVVVAAQPEVQLERLTTLRGMREEDARARIAAQAPLQDKLAIATHVIWNEGSLEDVLARTDEVAAELQETARAKAATADEGVPDD